MPAWTSGDPNYDTVLIAGFVFALFVAVAGVFVKSPYGRFADARWGFALDPRLGWLLMELPATVVFVLVFVRGSNRAELVPLLFLAMWLIHYGNRGFAFPLLIRRAPGSKASFGISVVVMGWFVTGVHGYLNAHYIAELGDHYGRSWLSDPRFIGGVLLYYAGFAANLHSDAIIRRLRTKAEVESGEKVYRIPRGGLFRWVSSPQYLSELVAWTGFAIATWCPGSLFVLAVSAANLIPRAAQTHRWYHERFADYPPERKALVPFVW